MGRNRDRADKTYLHRFDRIEGSLNGIDSLPLDYMRQKKLIDDFH